MGCGAAEVAAPGRGRRSTWLRGSHCGGRETPPHAAAHPPSRGGLLRGCSSPVGRRAAVCPRSARSLRLSPRTQLLASPAPCRARERSGGGGKGLRTRGSHSTTRPGPRRPGPAAGKGGGWRGRRWDPGRRGPARKRAGAGDPGSAESQRRRARGGWRETRQPRQAPAGRPAEGE